MKNDSSSASVSSYQTKDKDATDHEDHSGSHYTKRSDEEAEKLLAKSETRYVLRLRILVFLALLLAALAVSLSVYIITKNAETQQFEAGFDGTAQKIIDCFNDIVEVKIGAIADLAITMTEYARDRNMTWPFVTMSDFHQRATSARALSSSLFVQLYPIITNETRSAWESFSVQQKGWLDEGRAYQQKYNLGFSGRRGLQEEAVSQVQPTSVSFVGANSSTGPSVIADHIYSFSLDGVPIADPSPGPYFPAWQSSPIMAADLVNFNMLYVPELTPNFIQSSNSGKIALSGLKSEPPGDINSQDAGTIVCAFLLSFAAGKPVPYIGDPMTTASVPVFDSFNDDKRVVAVLNAAISWAIFFEKVLPPNARAMEMVLENTCDGVHTYVVEGVSVRYLGKGDLHESKDTKNVRTASVNASAGVRSNTGIVYELYESPCVFSLHVYPTADMYNFYYTNLPVIITVVIVLIFVFTAVMFLIYDRLVERRQRIVMNTAIKSSNIVSSLFPRQIRDRLFAEEGPDAPVQGTKTKLKSFLSGSGDQTDDQVMSTEARPIADLFLETTILFADIVGFTAWSSVREPSQVFSLLEALFRAFDDCASRRRVFKASHFLVFEIAVTFFRKDNGAHPSFFLQVETVGDCYVAVTGLPDPRKDHALAMARFARDCLNVMNNVLKELEVTLGPGTGDLRLRVGIHSGPVTAGVLRGERSRFQLFGDTMNTAARMESTGKPGQIQLSQDTANILTAAGRENWIRPREDLVQAKGKGIMQTYWLVYSGRGSDDARSSIGDSERETDQPLQGKQSIDGTNDKPQVLESIDKHQRLVDWNVEILQRLLKQIVARRMCHGEAKQKSKVFPVADGATRCQTNSQTVLDEVCEIIPLPRYDADAVCQQVKPETIVLSEAVLEQLMAYVLGIAALYRDNPFHNFEHASHVTMSVVKLLSRIVAPSDLDFEDGREASSCLHDHTYGITSDPLTQFACVLSALIHDADHPGVPNMQLIKEHSSLAQFYNNQSIAEQNSVDLCWDLLQDDRFQDLRNTIYSTDAELKRFRQLIVNSVMATDIMDKKLKELRNARWEKAFSESSANDSESCFANLDRKATIVIEHLIQASDVAHTMQHWHIYRKWNQRLFEEMYQAYRQGRSDTDPSVNWYKGELGFFDFYIVPLAQKLKDCGVFGVSTGEYMRYALENRREWESRGQELVADMLEAAQHKMLEDTTPSSDSHFELVEI